MLVDLQIDRPRERASDIHFLQLPGKLFRLHSFILPRALCARLLRGEVKVCIVDGAVVLRREFACGRSENPNHEIEFPVCQSKGFTEKLWGRLKECGWSIFTP